VPEDKLEKVKAGRANLPQKAIFYCANDIATACIECLTAGFTKGLSESKTVTLGTWEIKAPLVLAQVAFSLDKLEELKPLAPRIYEERIEFAKSWYQGIIEGFRNQNYPYSLDYAEKLIAFFSNEFGKTKIESGRDYNLSNFYCEYVFNQMFADDPHNVDGILYPSVKFGYKHYNIAIHPRAMSKLSFKSATQVWVTSNGTTDQVNFSFLETAFANGEGNILWNRFK
jgi:hypothetical protein